MTPGEVAEKAGTSPAYVHRVIQGKQRPNSRLMPYLNLLDGRSRELYCNSQREKGLHEHLHSMKLADELVGYHLTSPQEMMIEIPTKEPIAICNTADWQLGEHGVDYTQFEKDVETWATTDGLYNAVGGDTIQNIIQTSKMGSSHNQTQIVIQRAAYVLTLKKIMHNNLYIGTGNHNDWTTVLAGEDWDAELAHRLKLVYTKHCAKIWLKVGKMEYPMLRLHKGQFNSNFNLTHTCKQYQRMNWPQARIIVVEHHHVGAVEQYRYDERECVAIRTGTYAVYDDFALANGFFGSHVCNPTVVLYPNEDRIVPFKSQADALVYLKAVRS